MKNVTTPKRTIKDLLPAQRQNKIKDFLVETGFVSISALGEAFGVSEMTIRRDLDELERQGLIQRTYGGAVSTEPAFYEMSYDAKTTKYRDEKRRIGEAAAELIKPGQTIIFDSGTTTDQIVKHLGDIKITAITNALNIASLLMKKPGVEVLLAGGILRSGLNYTAGPQTSDFIKTIRADIFFLAVEGVDPRGGFTVPDLFNADNKRHMIRASQKVIAVTDHSKMGRVCTNSIVPLDQVHLLITDTEADVATIQEIRQHVEVLQV